MEESKCVEQTFEIIALGTAIEELRVHNGVFQVRTHNVGSKSFGRFIGHLDSVLEDGSGEVGGRVRSEPESELGVDLVHFFQVFADLLQGGHPTGSQMAILEHHPGAVFQTGVDQVLGVGALALTQGNLLDFLVHAGTEHQQAGEWVTTGGEDEDQRDRTTGVFVDRA